MMPDVVNRMPPRQRDRFYLAYDNARKRPIGWWEPDDIVVGLVQAWLFVLGENLPKSAWIETDGTIAAKGIFDQETFLAVQSFQRKMHIDADGMVGHDTLDALAWQLRLLMGRPAQPSRQVFVKPRDTIPPRPCSPDALICPDPDTDK
jgi:hypothetical protein